MNIDDTVIGLIRNDPNFTFHKECDNTKRMGPEAIQTVLWEFDSQIWRRIYIDILHVIMNDVDFPSFRSDNENT